MRLHRGFSWEALPKPWDTIFYVIMQYIKLEDHFQVIYYYHFPILNYFRNLDHISSYFFCCICWKIVVTRLDKNTRRVKIYTLFKRGL